MKQGTHNVTAAQRRVFRNLQMGREPRDGLSGMSAMGGLDRTLGSMRRRGWLTARDQLTDAGRDVCKQLGIEAQVRADQVTEEVNAIPFTPVQLLALFLRDAATHSDLTDDTVCSFGWWKTIPGDEFPAFNARIKVTLGELRRAMKRAESLP